MTVEEVFISNPFGITFVRKIPPAASVTKPTHPPRGGSVVENWDLLLAAQLFFAEFPELNNGVLENKYSNLSNSVFLRLQWSY